jgi:predicted esterase YcpF (UPF0227 family)
VIIYFHGFGSVGDTPKSFKLKEKFGADNVIAPDLPIDPIEVIKLVDDIVNNLTNCNDIVFVGTSLGGFYANYFSKKYRLNCVLINPSTNPSLTLKRKLGLNTNYATKKTFEVKQEYIDSWREMEEEVLNTDNSLVHLFLAKNDEVLNYHAALNMFFDSHEIKITDNGGHRYDMHWDKVIEVISEL